MYKVIAKQCSKCGLIKLLDHFCNSKDGKFKKKSQCKTCDKRREEQYKQKEKWITLWKPCSLCGKIKIGSEYNFSAKSYDGLAAKCKDCCHKKSKIHYLTNYEKIKQYRDSRSELQNIYNHEYYYKNRDEILGKQHEYNMLHKDKINARHKIYRQENPEYMIQYRKDKSEELKEWARNYRAEHPEKSKVHCAKRRELGYDPANIPEEGFNGHHLYLDEKQDLVIHMPEFLHRLYQHNHNKPETMITPNALALDFMIHEELYRIIYYEDTTFDTLAIDALDSGIITFVELSNMMHESRTQSNAASASSINTTLSEAVT